MLTNYIYIARYTLPISVCGFLPNHIYRIIIHEDNDTEGYNVFSDYDVTDDEDIDLVIRLSNIKSIERYFNTEEV